MVSEVLIPTVDPLNRIFNSWQSYGYGPLTKKKLVFYCNTTWLRYNLNLGECWPFNVCFLISVLSYNWNCSVKDWENGL